MEGGRGKRGQRQSPCMNGQTHLAILEDGSGRGQSVLPRVDSSGLGGSDSNDWSLGNFDPDRKMDYACCTGKDDSLLAWMAHETQ